MAHISYRVYSLYSTYGLRYREQPVGGAAASAGPSESSLRSAGHLARDRPRLPPPPAELQFALAMAISSF